MQQNPEKRVAVEEYEYLNCWPLAAKVVPYEKKHCLDASVCFTIPCFLIVSFLRFKGGLHSTVQYTCLSEAYSEFFLEYSSYLFKLSLILARTFLISPPV